MVQKKTEAHIHFDQGKRKRRTASKEKNLLAVMCTCHCIAGDEKRHGAENFSGAVFLSGEVFPLLLGYPNVWRLTNNAQVGLTSEPQKELITSVTRFVITQISTFRSTPFFAD